MAEVTREGVTIHYEDEGSGLPVVLIHGHTLDRRVWEPVMPGLLAGGLRVIRPDLRGHGLSSRPDFGYRVSDHVADILAVLDAAAVESAMVVGFSIGGAVALEMALTHADRVTGLVLMAPVMPDRPFDPEFMDNLKQVARAARTEGIAAAMAGPWAASPLLTASMTKAEVREAAENITRDFPGAEYLATQRDAVERSWKVPDRLSEIDQPTTVIVGALEMTGFRAFADEAVGGIPGATLEVIPGCGHLIPLEEPESTTEFILAEVRRASA